MTNTPIITEVKYLPIRPDAHGLIGFASCVWDGKLSLNSIAIHTKRDGEIRLLFPSKKLPNGKELQCFYTINTEGYNAIKDAIEIKINSINKE